MSPCLGLQLLNHSRRVIYNSSFIMLGLHVHVANTSRDQFEMNIHVGAYWCHERTWWNEGITRFSRYHLRTAGIPRRRVWTLVARHLMISDIRCMRHILLSYVVTILALRFTLTTEYTTIVLGISYPLATQRFRKLICICVGSWFKAVGWIRNVFILRKYQQSMAIDTISNKVTNLGLFYSIPDQHY